MATTATYAHVTYGVVRFSINPFPLHTTQKDAHAHVTDIALDVAGPAPLHVHER